MNGKAHVEDAIDVAIRFALFVVDETSRGVVKGTRDEGEHDDGCAHNIIEAVVGCTKGSKHKTRRQQAQECGDYKPDIYNERVLRYSFVLFSHRVFLVFFGSMARF